MCKDSVKRLPVNSRARLRIWETRDWRDISWGQIRRNQTSPLLIVSRLEDIPTNGQALKSLGQKQKRYLLFTENMPVEAIPARVPCLNVRDPHRLHIAQASDPHKIAAIIQRTIGGYLAEGRTARIADAWIEDDWLVVLSPCFDRLTVPICELFRLTGTDRNRIGAFEIDVDGSFLYWTGADVHLGWDQLRCLIDPSAAIAARRRSGAFNKRYGAAIKALRQDRQILQSQVPGLTGRHLRRVEKGDVATTTKTIKALAKAHNITVADYMAELAKRLG